MSPRFVAWWLVPLAATTACADLIGANDLHRVDCVTFCEATTGGGGPGPVTDPTRPASGTVRPSRGGSFYSQPMYCRSAFRSPDVPDALYNDTGFRLARSIP